MALPFAVAAVKDTLGPKRYEEYLVTKDPLYRQAQMTATQYGAPPKAIMAIYEMSRANEQKRQKILADAALTPQQKFGNALATRLIRIIWRTRYTDLGPFRAIRWSSYESLGMCDPNYGWTVEMQIKAIRKRLRVTEIDVPYRSRRAGVSKVAGSLKGSIKAGYKILYLIARYSVSR